RGNRFSGIARLAFLNILQTRCRELGVKLRFHTNVADVAALEPCDLLVGADGANSLVRRAYAETFQPTIDWRKNKYIWLGTHHLFHGLTLTFREHEAGLFIAHSYKFNDTTSTFIVECGEAVWADAGFAEMSEADTCAYLAEVFKRDLDGHALLANNFVRWLNFPLIKNREWHHRNVVLLGDALHTAHFSIGSGTKLALEDAIGLARCFTEGRDVGAALAEFQRLRKPVIDAYQDAAFASLLMFENAAEDMRLDPLPFAFKMMTRSKKIDYDKLRRRDPQFIAAYDAWREKSGVGRQEPE
ncbi:MAG TPA: FAD-dependent monooxygenase, partial [Blastocatellia bacterium]|nr:FAD-dependent monooxygenase [Blastocatellia bacterium]